MGNFLAKVFFSLLVVILVIATTALGVLYFVKNNDLTNSQNELSKAKDDLKNANDKIIELQGQSKDPNAKFKFQDTGLGIKGEFPYTWTVSSNTKVETETVTTTTTLKSVEFKFTRDSSSVTLTRMFGPVGDIGVGYPTSQYDVKVLNTKIIRFADKGTNQWKYVAKINCSDVLDLAAGADVCGGGSFFPGFGTGAGAASFASADIKDAKLLEEADAIVLSTIN